MIGRFFKILFISLILISSALVSAVLGQEISTNIEPSFGMSNDSFMLTVTVKGEINKITAPSLGRSKEFIITASGTSTRTEIINGRESNELSFNYELAPRANLPAGEYLSPSGSIHIDDTKYEIPAKKITIVNSPPKEQQANSDKIKINQFTDKEIAYLGEQITYTVQVISGPDFLGGNLDDIEVLGFWREKLGEQEKKVFNAGLKTITTFQEVLIPNKSGEITIPSRKLHAQIEGPSRRVKMGGLSSVFDSNFLGGLSIMTRTQLKRDFATKPIKINVKPLPASKLKGYVPVGNLNLRSSIDKNTVKHGESINLKIRLSGFANLRPLEIEKPKDDNFKIYIDPAETNVSYERARVRFTKIFNVVLIPNISGELELPKFQFNYFDPHTEEYKVLSTDAVKIIAEGSFDDRVKNETEQEEQIEVDTNEILSSFNKINLKISIIISAIFSSLAIAISLFFYFKKDKNLHIMEPALNIALNEINSDKELSVVFKSYLGRKLKKNLSSMTLNEIQIEILEPKLKDSSLSKEILAEIERQLYNPNKKISEEFRNKFITMLSEIDHEI